MRELIKKASFPAVRFSLALGVLLIVIPAVVRAQPVGTSLADVHVGVPPSQDVGPILYAEKAGLFAKVGLNVILEPLTSGAAISAAVAGGTIQIGFSSLQGLISGHARGIPFTLIVAGGVYTSDDPYAYMFVKKDAPYKSAADLDGKTLGSPALKDLDWIANASWMEKNGGDFKSTKAVELPNPALLPALEAGRLDAYTVGQPWATIALDSGNVRILAKSFEAIAPRLLMTGWFSTSDYVNANRSVIDRFNRVLHDATVYANAHKSEIVPLLAAFTKLDPSTVARTMKGTEGEYLDPALIQPMIDASAKYGIIDKTFAADDLISPSALKKGN